MSKNTNSVRILSLVVAFSVLVTTLLGTIGLSVSSNQLPDEPSATQVWYYGNTYYDYADIDFSEFGVNMIPDSTVSKFEGGVYKSYYDLTTDANGGVVADPNAWWDKVAYKNQYFADTSDTTYASMKIKGVVSSDTSISHTNDGSGALNLIKAKYYLPLPQLEARSYYLVTGWINYLASNKPFTPGICDSLGESVYSKTIQRFSSGWKRVSIIYYTGASAQNEASLYLNVQTNAVFDELEVYKLDATYAQDSIEAGKLVSDGGEDDDNSSSSGSTSSGSTSSGSTSSGSTSSSPSSELSDAEETKNVTVANLEYQDYANFEFNKLENIISDPTVAKFDTDNKYKSYYDLAADATGGTVKDASAWWDKAANNSQYFNQNVAIYGSMNSRGLVTYDTEKSHTNDGSSAIKIDAKKSNYLPLPKLDAKTYYIITLWINNTVSSGVSTQLFNSGLSPVSTKTQNSLSSGWQRITWLYYTGKNAQSAPVFYIYSDYTAYIDDFGVYKIGADYGKECMTAGKLVSEEDRLIANLPNEKEFKQITFGEENKIYQYSKFNWASLGDNLITDPTVNAFDGEGNYKNYYVNPPSDYTVANEDAWWDNPANDWQAHYVNIETTPWRSMAARGCTSKDTKKSHTDDGSGVLYVEATNGQNYLALPKMQEKSYYVVSFWVKFIGSKNNDIVFQSTYDNDRLINYSTFNTFSWRRVSFLIYTGSNNYSEPNIRIYNTGIAYIDDFSVYKLSTKYGKECMEAGHLVYDEIDSEGTPPEDPVNEEDLTSVVNASYNANKVYYDYSDFDWSTLGDNLIPDEKVEAFGSDGVYKNYYTNPPSDKSIANADAWWDNPANDYQAYSNNSKPWESVKKRGYVVNDPALSHTADGSGVIYVSKTGNQTYFALPKMTLRKYYVVSFWVKFTGKNGNDIAFMSTTDDTLKLNINGTGDWMQITYIIYTGALSFEEPNIRIYNNSTYYVDDIRVYELGTEYGRECLDAKKLVYKNLNATVTPEVDGYDFEKEGNLFEDGSFEGNKGVKLSGAKYGKKVWKSSDSDKSIKIDGLEGGVYYLVNYWIKSSASGKVTTNVISDNNSVYNFNTNVNTTWKKVTLFVNSGDKTEFTLNFTSSLLSSGKAIYIDGLSVHKVPDGLDICAAALDNYIEGNSNITLLNMARDAFGDENDDDSYEYKAWRKLVSPIKGESYVALYARYYKEYLRQDKINRGFAPSGEGERRYYSNKTCEDADNLVANAACDDKTYWKDTSGYLTVSTDKSKEGKTSLKVSGKGIFRKRISNLKSNTWYALSVEGNGIVEDGVPDTHFGIMDNEGRLFENPISDYELGSWTREAACKQEITILCPDSTWYNRVYYFNTGDNTSVDFFITSTEGTMYLDDIRIYEKSKEITKVKSESYDDILVYEYDIAEFACKDSDNLFANGKFDKGTEFWGNFRGMNKFVEVATSKGNKMLHYKDANRDFYYLAGAKVKANVDYTFSFWAMNMNGEGAKYGAISLKGPRYFISEIETVDHDYGEWKLISIKFKAYRDTDVYLGVFDGGGEAVFDNVRLFESSKGYAMNPEDDVPVGGTEFEETILGTNGIQENPDDDSEESTNKGDSNDDALQDNVQSEQETENEEDTDEDDYQDTESDDEDYEELDSEEDEEEDEDDKKDVVTKVVKKYKKPFTVTRLAPWFIALLIGGGVVVAAGIAVLIIFLVKRRKKKHATQ